MVDNWKLHLLRAPRGALVDRAAKSNAFAKSDKAHDRKSRFITMLSALRASSKSLLSLKKSFMLLKNTHLLKSYLKRMPRVSSGVYSYLTHPQSRWKATFHALSRGNNDPRAQSGISSIVCSAVLNTFVEKGGKENR